MGVGKFSFRMNPGAIDKILRTDPRAEMMCRDIAEDVVDEAKRVFAAAQRWDNESRTSEYTPPKYLESFGVRKTGGGRYGIEHQAYNDDPGWSLVEWGAHPGGRPDVFVLRYKPLTRAFVIVATRHAAGGRR